MLLAKTIRSILSQSKAASMQVLNMASLALAPMAGAAIVTSNKIAKSALMISLARPKAIGAAHILTALSKRAMILICQINTGYALLSLLIIYAYQKILTRNKAHSASR